MYTNLCKLKTNSNTISFHLINHFLLAFYVYLSDCGRTRFLVNAALRNVCEPSVHAFRFIFPLRKRVVPAGRFIRTEQLSRASLVRLYILCDFILHPVSSNASTYFFLLQQKKEKD